MTRRLAFLGLFAFLTAASVHGQPPTPALNAVPSPFRSYIVYDGRYPLDDPKNRQDKMHCMVCENGLAPAVAIFSRTVPPDGNAPLARLMKALQPLIPKYRGDRFATYVIFLRTDAGTKDVIVKQADGSETKVTLDKEFPDDDRTKLVVDPTDPMQKKPPQFTFDREDEVRAIRGDTDSKKPLGGFAAAVATPNIPLCLAATKSKLTDSFGIKEGDDITVVLYNRLFIEQRWSFKPNELDDAMIAEIAAAAENTVKGLGK